MTVLIALALLCFTEYHKVMCQEPLYHASPKTAPPRTTTPRRTTTGTNANEFNLDSTVTDMPEENVDEALFPEVGHYSTQLFQYVNMQNKPFDKFAEFDKCLDHYVKCLTTLTIPVPVCAYHSYTNKDYLSKNSFCDVHLENCRLGKRHWKILTYGTCKRIEEGEVLYEQLIQTINDLALKAAQTMEQAWEQGSIWAEQTANWLKQQNIFFWQG